MKDLKFHLQATGPFNSVNKPTLRLSNDNYLTEYKNDFICFGRKTAKCHLLQAKQLTFQLYFKISSICSFTLNALVIQAFITQQYFDRSCRAHYRVNSVNSYPNFGNTMQVRFSTNHTFIKQKAYKFFSS